MANPEHLAILKQGVEAWNRWREENPTVKPDLSHEDFVGWDLAHANLSFVELTGSDLTGTHLTNSDLSGTIFMFTNFLDTNLERADFSHCLMSSCLLNDTDLSQVKGLEKVNNHVPSSIGTDTLVLTLRGSGGRFTDEQIVFFERAGVPPILLEYLPGMLESNPIQFYSCFISYSTQDEEFATRLNEDLNAAGVRTWKWNTNSVAGRDIEANIDAGVRVYDKIILLCSVHSLTSGPVQDEIRRAIEKEHRLERAKADAIKRAREANEPPPANFDTDVLVPINLDGYVFEWDSPLAVHVKRKSIPNFSGKTSRRNTAYRRELEKLIHDLSPKSWPIKGIQVNPLELS